MKTSRCILASLAFLLVGAALSAAAFSPGEWSATERAELERLEERTRPDTNRVVEVRNGFVAGTMSAIAVRVGVEVLKQNGTAADAAAAVALTQVSRALGSYVSYAGIAQILYFEASSGRVYAIDAGWGSYRGEVDPMTIPGPTITDRDQGRKTLVPGFMAGIEAMHGKFGVLPFKSLFEPAIWYAENDVTITNPLASYFQQREKILSRTESGRRFLHQASGSRPKKGQRFVQADLAVTLRAVAEQGAGYMYSGAWGQRYVDTVRREGGKITQADMDNYQPIWQEPLSTTFAGHTVFGPGVNSEGGYQALEALNLIEALAIENAPPYWQDPRSFQQLSRVLNITDVPAPWMLDRAKSRGVTLALSDRASKSFAATLAPLVDSFFKPPAKNPAPEHTAGIVVVDGRGNVAAIVHSINSVLWGSTGLVVDGVPISDPAAIVQTTLASIKPGERVPDLMVPMIATRNDRATLAVAITGSVQRETVRIVLGLLGYRSDLETLMSAPPLITVNGPRQVEFVLPDESYDAGFLAKLRDLGSTFNLVPPPQAKTMRGVGVFGIIDQESKQWRSIEMSELFGFSSGY